MKEANSIQRRRKFSASFKKSLVQDFERGKLTVLEISREYDLHVQLIYNWIRKYSIYPQKGYQVVVEEKSLSQNNEQLRQRVAELEAMVGRKQMEVEYLQKLIELSSEDLGIDLKKKHGAVPSSGSGTTKPNTPGK